MKYKFSAAAEASAIRISSSPLLPSFVARLRVEGGVKGLMARV